ncbi:hypothetical protein [Planococcus salinarum]|uniref:hypothetical protein n=1 Tax=Planococcus salinarum TaxID=622695 RepID=UPI0012B695AC|nr:hypothetical protein [Planococcus salinarum]
MAKIFSILGFVLGFVLLLRIGKGCFGDDLVVWMGVFGWEMVGEVDFSANWRK